MVKRNKIVICFVIALACVTFCLLPIVASANVASEISSTLPDCPYLTGAYRYSSYYNTRTVGGYASHNASATGTQGSWYMYCYQPYADGRQPQLFGDFDYENDGFGFVPNDIYYGATSERYDGESSITFSCLNTESFGFYIDWFDIDSSVTNYWEYEDTLHFEVLITYRDDEGNTYRTVPKSIYYDDFDMFYHEDDSTFWKDSESLFQYCGVDSYEYFITNVTFYYPTNTGIAYGVNLYFHINNGSQYIAQEQYLQNILDMNVVGNEESYENGFNEGFGSGYQEGLRSEDNVSYSQGFEDGSDFNETGVWGMISSSVGGFLGFEIYGGFTIGQLLMICLAVPLFIWIIKLLAGG